MANDALEAARGSTDFNQFDNDDNGFVDCFVVVHAGKDAAETGSARDIWSVKWTLDKERELDGVKVYGFMTVPEDAKCGVCAHELGHLVFGWPDLYDIDHTSSGVGNWCLMSFGLWGCNGDRPVHPSAWCKASQGWVETITETENHEIVLEDIKASHRAHKLWTNGDSSSQEYFLIENRQLGGFDEFLPGTGLLVWHIDDAVWSNTDELHPKVKLIQADGLGEFKGNWGRGDAGDAYPGFSARSAFDSSTTPSSKAYSGQETFVSITNIPPSSSSMKLNITVLPSSGRPASAGFDPTMWYRLKNSYMPTTHCLDVINDNHFDSKGLLNMARDGNYSGQHWQIKSNGDGTYFLCTLFLGPDRRLDVHARDKSTPILSSSANVTGQYWRIEPYEDGTWHLENAYCGQHQYFDLMDGGVKARMNPADASKLTQRWTITPIREIHEEKYLDEELPVRCIEVNINRE